MATYTRRTKTYIKVGILIVSFFLLYFYFVSSNGHKKHKGDNILIWSEDRKLNVSDFRAYDKNDLPSKPMSGAFMGIQQYFYVDNDTLIYSVRAFLDLDSTFWGFGDLALTRLNDSILNQRYKKVLKHAQVGFDLYEIYARKIREIISACVYVNDTENMRDTITSFQKDLYTMIRLYEVTTQHSLIDTEQQKWNQWVEQDLEAFKEYEAPEGKILLKRNDEAETGDSVTFQKLASPKK